jgi:hypothetical protein
MRNGKHRLEALALAIMTTLGVMALGVAGAQAQLPGESKPGTFLVNLGVALLATLTGQILGVGFLLVKDKDLKIECKALDINSGKINSSTDGSAEVLFLECVARNHAGVQLADCEFKTLKTIKALVLVLPILHGGEPFLLFEPLSGTELANVSFKSGTACTLPLNNPVTGAVVAKVDALDAIKQEILFSEAIQLLSGDVLKYSLNNNTAYLDGIADIWLTLGHNNHKLSVH